jgi:hypothetical protein
MSQFTVKWIDRGKEPNCAPDAAYPAGVDLDCSEGERSCVTELPYPAKRCGVYIVDCKKCGMRVGVTTAGRADDPKSLRMSCKPVLQ